MGMTMPSLSLYHHPKACMSHSFLLRGRVQQYLPTKVPGKVPSGHWFTNLGTWPASHGLPVGITCLLCESDGMGSQHPRLGSETEL